MLFEVRVLGRFLHILRNICILLDFSSFFAFIPPCTRRDHRLPPLDEKEPHTSGPTVSQIGGGMKAKKRRKIQQDANIAQNMEETA